MDRPNRCIALNRLKFAEVATTIAAIVAGDGCNKGDTMCNVLTVSELWTFDVSA